MNGKSCCSDSGDCGEIAGYSKYTRRIVDPCHQKYPIHNYLAAYSLCQKNIRCPSRHSSKQWMNYFCIKERNLCAIYCDTPLPPSTFIRRITGTEERTI